MWERCVCAPLSRIAKDYAHMCMTSPFTRRIFRLSRLFAGKLFCFQRTHFKETKQLFQASSQSAFSSSDFFEFVCSSLQLYITAINRKSQQNIDFDELFFYSKNYTIYSVWGILKTTICSVFCQKTIG